MPSDDDQITVARDDAQSRYEVNVGDVVAGFTEYERDAVGRLLFTHTEVDPAFKGRGLSKRLVADAMEDAAAQGATVVPLCSVVSKYLREHEVAGLVVDWPNRATVAE